METLVYCTDLKSAAIVRNVSEYCSFFFISYVILIGSPEIRSEWNLGNKSVSNIFCLSENSFVSRFSWELVKVVSQFVVIVLIKQAEQNSIKILFTRLKKGLKRR